jgi:hypothetical protein
MSTPASPPPPIRSAAPPPTPGAGDRLPLGGAVPPRCAHRTPDAALRAPGPALPRRLQLRTTAS